MTPRVKKAAVLIHMFFAADHATRNSSPTQIALTDLWGRLGDQGLDQPIDSHWPQIPSLTNTPPARLTVLAARQKIIPGEFHQALMYRLHDVIGVTVLQAPNDDDLAWSDLNDTWHEDITRADMEGFMSGITLYLGQLSPRGGQQEFTPEDATSIGRNLRGLLPPDRRDWSRCWCLPTKDLILWEMSPSNAVSQLQTRRLVAVTDEATEDAMDRWLWSGDAPGLAPFTRYLLHASKLRYEQVVLQRESSELQHAIDQVDDACSRLVALLNDDVLEVDKLLSADRTLSALQTRQRGLIALLTDVRDMTRTVEVTQENMDSSLGTELPCAPCGPIENDRQHVRWTLKQLHTAETYLSSAQLKAAEVTRITGSVVDRHLLERREKLNLLQTTLIGALLMMLAAIQSLRPQLPLPGPLTAPVICLLGAVALLLPSALLYGPKGSSRKGPWRNLIALFIGFSGGASGWLSATLVIYLCHRKAASPPLSLLTAMAGAVGATAAWLAFTSRRRPSTAHLRR